RTAATGWSRAGRRWSRWWSTGSPVVGTDGVEGDDPAAQADGGGGRADGDDGLADGGEEHGTGGRDDGEPSGAGHRRGDDRAEPGTEQQCGRDEPERGQE